MFNKRMQYVIKTVPTDDTKALENLLNDMSKQGWDLYTMHEVENEDSIDFNCIFMKEHHNEEKTNLDDIVNITSFKDRMEKMLSASTSPFDTCKDLQLKISNKKNRIKNIKSELDKDGLSVDDKNELNNQMSEELRQLDILKQTLVNEISPATMYSSMKEECISVYLSEELIELISMEDGNNLLSETVRIRQNLAETLGYVIPQIYFHNDDALSQFEFSIKIHDIEVFRDVVFPTYIAYPKGKIKGYRKNKDDIVLDSRLFEKELIWIPQEKVKDFWENGITPIEYIGQAIEHISIKEVSDIIDYNDINKYLEIVLEKNSFLVDNIIPDFLTASDLKYLLSSLIRERVSVKNIIYLFEKINDYANEPTKEDLLDKIRLAFSKLIIKDLAKEHELKIITLKKTTTEQIYGFLDTDDSDSIVRIDSYNVQSIADKILQLMETKKIEKPILVVPMEIRHMTFVILSEFLSKITVLAQEELTSDYDIKFIGKI